MSEPFDTITDRVSLEVEGLALLVAGIVAVGLSVFLAFAGYGVLGGVPMIAWFIWFFAWASKGGIPPRY